MKKYTFFVDVDEKVYVSTVTTMQIKAFYMALDQAKDFSGEASYDVVKNIQNLIGCQFDPVTSAESEGNPLLVRVRKNLSTDRYNLHSIDDQTKDTPESLDWSSALSSYHAALTVGAY